MGRFRADVAKVHCSGQNLRGGSRIPGQEGLDSACILGAATILRSQQLCAQGRLDSHDEHALDKASHTGPPATPTYLNHLCRIEVPGCDIKRFVLHQKLDPERCRFTAEWKNQTLCPSVCRAAHMAHNISVGHVVMVETPDSCVTTLVAWCSAAQPQKASEQSVNLFCRHFKP